MIKLCSYLNSGLERFDLFKIFSIGSVGVVQGTFEFTDVRFELLFNARDLRFVTGLNLNKSALKLFNNTSTATSVKLNIALLNYL